MHFSPFLFQLRFQWPRSVITTSTRLFCCCLLWYHQKLIKHDRRIVMQEIIDTEKIAVNESSVFHQPFPPPYYVTYFSKGSYVHECFGYFQNNRSLDIWYHWSFIFWQKQLRCMYHLYSFQAGVPRFGLSIDCVKSVQIRTFFWSPHLDTFHAVLPRNTSWPTTFELQFWWTF